MSKPHLRGAVLAAVHAGWDGRMGRTRRKRVFGNTEPRSHSQEHGVAGRTGNGRGEVSRTWEWKKGLWKSKELYSQNEAPPVGRRQGGRKQRIDGWRLVFDLRSGAKKKGRNSGSFLPRESVILGEGINLSAMRKG